MAATMMLKLTPAQRYFVGELYRKIDHEPQVLLEHDSTVPRGEFEVTIARLIGREDELVDEWLLPEPLDRLRRAEKVPMWELRDPLSPEDAVRPAYRESLWLPQSVYATGVLDHLDAGDWPVNPATFQCRVLALRYRLAPGS